MNRTILLTGTLFGLLAILLGAFGAHGLEKLIEPKAIATFETGVRYQIYHALLLLILGNWDGIKLTQKRIIFRLVWIGTVLFSFSIYLLATNSLFSWDFRKIALLTPLGGSVLIAAWAFLAYCIWSNNSNK